MVLGLALAGAAGAVLRLVADHYLPRVGILLVNVVGSFVAGVATGLLTDEAQFLWLTGVAGALTTFSTVSVATARLVLDGHLRSAAGSWALHLGLGLLAVAVGLGVGLSG